MVSLFRLVFTLALLTPTFVNAADVETIRKEIESTWKLPAMDRSRTKEPDQVQAHQERVKETLNRRVDLIGELYRVAPTHPDIRELMMKRWAAMLSRPLADRREELASEVAQIAAKAGNPLQVDAAYINALLSRPAARGGDPDPALKPIEAFIALAPKDERGAQLLVTLTRIPSIPAERRAAITSRILAEYPDSAVANTIKATQKRAEAIGKPFDLTFRDAVKGESINVQQGLKDKVVVIDFWATWCGPCLAEIPNMKLLYSQFKDKGVEFIGVSLDDPGEKGLAAVQSFVKERQVEWPQFQGEASLDFARNWAITEIPTLFIVDRQGRLHSVEARGKLETLIPELLRSDPNDSPTPTNK